MNFKFATKINPKLEKLDFKGAIAIGEKELKKIPITDFHHIVGKTLTSQSEDLADWVNDFCKRISKRIDIKSLYFEMNEFDINTDAWYIDSFAFSKDGGLDLDDMEWLTEFDADSQTETETIFQIEGLERLQAAFESIEINSSNLQKARDWCEQIIIARFMEMVREAHLIAKQKGHAWATLPIYFTEHAYDFVVRSEIK